MKHNKTIIALICLICALTFILNSCSSIYGSVDETTEKNNNTDNESEYFTVGQTFSIGSATLGVVYEGQWIYVETSDELITTGSTTSKTERIVKYNPVTAQVSSPCLNPNCFHTNDECLVCAPHGWTVSYIQIIGDWMLYSFINLFSEKDDFFVRKTYLYNLKTGEMRDFHSRSKEDMIFNITNASYVMNDKIYSTLNELDYTGAEEYKQEGFVPQTRQFVEVYDPKANKTERLCEVPSEYLLVSITNKRLIFEDSQGAIWTCNYSGENWTRERNMPSNFMYTNGTYAYPVETVDYDKAGYHIRGYDLSTDSMFNITFGYTPASAVIAQNKLYFSTVSNIDEYQKFIKNTEAYVTALYPDITNRSEISQIKKRINLELLYNGTFQLYETNAKGDNMKLIFEDEHVYFNPIQITDNYIFGTVYHKDPEMNYANIESEVNGRCAFNIATGEFTAIPTLE